MVSTKPTLSKLGGQQIETVVSRGVFDQLTPEEIKQAFDILFEKMKTPDPDNPNLWTVEIAGHMLWGILDEGAGPKGESVISIIFPSEY